MKISVLSGSPKGEKSVTLQYARYIAKHFPAHEFQYFHIGGEIHKLEKDKGRFSEILECVRTSDAIVWCTPVFFLLVPSQLVRFIELVFENQSQGAFHGKPATALITSAKYYDHTALQYLQAVSQDLKMNYVEGHSSRMEDLLDPSKRGEIQKFWKYFLECVQEKTFCRSAFPPEAPVAAVYAPPQPPAMTKSINKNILLITDAKEGDENLNRMIDVFVLRISCRVEIVNIAKLDIKGGCLSCYLCAEGNQCVYHDGLRGLHDKLFAADAIVMAGNVRHRFLSARWKMFFDRLFVFGHAPMCAGKQFAFILSGDYTSNPQLREVLEGLMDTSRANIAGTVTDESGDTGAITRDLEALGKTILFCLDEGYVRQQTFLGVGGHKIFRDLVYEAQWFFRADYAYYAAHGLLDYPQKNLGLRWRNLWMGLLMRFSGFRKSFFKQALAGAVKPYEKVVAK